MTARRVRIIALVSIVLLAAVVFVPQLPPVRGWLLEQVRDAVAARGFELRWDDSAGNPWSGVRLTDAEVEGPGLDVQIERLGVGWFLPSLVAGELPLSIDIAGISGDVDIDELPTGGNGGGDPPVRPVFEEVEVRDVALVVNNAPFTLPDLTVRDVALEQRDGRFAFAAEAVTPDGSLRATGEVGLSPFTLEADIERADATLVRHWWDGITAGTAQGTVRVDGGGIRVDAEVAGGAIDWLGLDARNIRGPIRYEHPIVEGELTGTVLGGPVQADATVDVGARRWQGTLDGAAGVPEVARWIARDLAFDPDVLQLTGDAAYTLGAVGWTTVNLEGDATAAGTVRGMPFDDLEADILFTSGEGLRVDAVGDVAGGDLRVSVANLDDGLRIRAGASGITAGRARVSTADVDLTFTGDGPRGEGSAVVATDLAGRSTSMTVDLVADPEGLQFFAEGTSGSAAVTGAAVVDGSTLEGGFRVAGLDLPGVVGEPVASADVAGTLDELDFEVALSSPDPLQVSAAGVTVDADLRGQVTGTLRDLRAWDLQGDLGPLAVAGSGDFTEGTVEASLDEVGVTGRVETRASVEEATLTYGSAGATLDGRVAHEVLTSSGVVLEPTTWTLSGDLGGAPSLTARAVGDQAVVTWGQDGFDATLVGLRLDVAGRSPELEGRIRFDPGEGIASLRGDLTATLPEGRISLDAVALDDEVELRVDAELPAGTRAGPVALAEPLALRGTIDLPGQSVDLRGETGAVRLDVRGTLGPAPNARIEVSSGQEQLTVTVGGDDGITARGRLDIGPVADVLGLSASGTIDADLRLQDGAYVGSARVDATAPVPFRAELTGAGDRVLADVSGSLGGQEIALSGTVVPSLSLAGSVGPLHGMTVAETELAGTGTLPRAEVGPLVVPEQLWQLDGSLAAQRAVLRAGESEAIATWSDGWRVQVDVRQPAMVGDLAVVVVAEGSIGAGEPDGSVVGRVVVDEATADASAPGVLATFSGDLQRISFQVAASADTLLTAVVDADVLRGDVRLVGTISPTTGAVDAAGTWSAAGASADLSVEAGAGRPLRATAEGAAFELRWADGALVARGNGGDIAPFLAPDVLGTAGVETLMADGELRWAGGDWSGTLALDAALPGTELTVSGAGERLLADARVDVAGGALQATGTVVPVLDLSLSSDAGPVSVRARVSGPYAEPRVDARVALAAQEAGPLTLGATEATVQGTLSPLDLRLQGPEIDAALRAGALEGTVTLRGTVDGEPQAATLVLGGSPATPTATAELTGPVSGVARIDLEGLHATLAVAPEAFPDAAPLGGPVRVTLTADRTLAWEADVQAGSVVAGAPLDLTLTASGQRLAYEGQGRIASAGGTLAALRVRGEGADAALVADAAAMEPGALDPLLPFEQALDASGEVRLETAPFLAEGMLALEGSIAGAPATASARLEPDGRIHLDARVADAALTAESEDLRTVAYTLAWGGSPAARLDGALDLAPESAAALALSGQGTLQGTPLTVDATYTGASAEAGARAEVALRSGYGDLQLVATAPPTSEPAASGSPSDDTPKEWTVSLDGGTTTGPVPLQASLTGPLALTGPAGAQLRLGGTLALLEQDVQVDVELGAQPDRVLVALETEGLILRAELGPNGSGAAEDEADQIAGFGVRSAILTGAGSVEIAGTTAIVSAPDGLRWSPTEGFSGRADVQAVIAALASRMADPVTAAITGDGGLHATVTALGGIATADLTLTETPWSDPAIAGSVVLDVPQAPLDAWPLGGGAAATAPAAVGAAVEPTADAEGAGEEAADIDADTGAASEAATATGASIPPLPGFQGELIVSGTYFAPAVEGPVAMTGTVDAIGRLRYADGAADLQLSGEDVRLSAAAGTDGWRAEAALDRARLGVLPLADAALTGRVQATGDWSGDVAAAVNGVRIDTAGGTVEAEASIGASIALSLRLDLPLADLQVGPDLVGRVQGPLVVRLPSVAGWQQAEVEGALDVRDAGVAGIPGRLTGDLGLRGTLPDVVAYARLQGTDGATGSLDLAADLRSGEVDVRSTLAYAGLTTDLTLESTTDGIQASGTVRWEDVALQLSPADGAIGLTGIDALRGWTGVLEPSAWSLELHGPVEPITASFAPIDVDARGEATLRARLDPAPAATLVVEDLRVAGRVLGRVQAEFAGMDAPVSIQGDHLRGAVALGGGADWTVALDALPLLPDARATGVVRSEGGTLQADLSVEGSWLDVPIDLNVDAGLGETWRATVAGTALSGTVAVDAARDAAGVWAGALQVAGAELSGWSVDAIGELSGNGPAPAVRAETTVAGPVDAAGTLQASLAGVRLDQQVQVPSLDAPLGVTGSVWPNLDLQLAAADGDALRLTAADWTDALESSGRFTIPVAGARVVVEGDPLRVRVDGPLEGLAMEGVLASEGASLLGVLGELGRGGIALEGRESTSGVVALESAPLRVDLREFAYEHPSGVRVRASGAVALDAAEVTGDVVLPPVDVLERFEGLPVGEPLPFRLTGTDDGGFAATFETSAGDVAARYGIAEGRLAVSADLALGGGRVDAELTFAPDEGLLGEATLTDVVVPTVAGADPLALDGTLSANRNEVEVALRGALNGSNAQIAGVWSLGGLLPEEWLPPGGGRRNLEVRLREFDPTTLPYVAGRVPNLAIPLSGVLQIQPNRVFGRLLSTDLRVLNEELPLTLDVTGTFTDLNVQGTLGRTSIQVTAGADELQGYIRLERFPAHLGIQALLGETDVTAEVTGVLRATVPLGGGEPPEVRLATERIRLERDGVVTLGNVSASFYDGVFTVEEASFEGIGTYRAEGVIRQNELDFTLHAADADFGPLLGLVPPLARLNADASGNLDVRAQGTLADPQITAVVDGLDVSIAGGTYRIPSARVGVMGEELRLQGVVEGEVPIDGRVAFDGGGRIGFTPFDLGRIDVAVTGRADVPLIGQITDLNGLIAFGGGEQPTLALAGSVGNQIRVTGTLAPLDLSVRGEDLAVTSPTFLLASSQLDIDAQVVQDATGEEPRFVASGGIFADQARFELGIREVDPEAGREPNPTMERIVFDDIRIQAPRQLTLSENFGTLEGRADLTLSGTAAAPELAGRAEAVRGNVRFFGRDFTLASAEAIFERARGIYPTIALRATTTAEKSRVLAGVSDDVRFVAPREGSSFDIDLAIAGEVEPTPSGPRAFRLQMETELSSDARIEVRGENAFASGPRPLLDAELMAVITLGRLEINPNLAAEEGIATAVAGTALDTVVDYLLVSELQRSLSEALGVDLVEIRTSNLSEVFSGAGEDPFSVSFRLGGYLTDELFASYRIGRFDDAAASFGLTNEVRFTYELGPVEFDLAGSVGFDASAGGVPVPGLNAAVRYEVTPLIDLETSLDLSNEAGRARFGVTFRW